MIDLIKLLQSIHPLSPDLISHLFKVIQVVDLPRKEFLLKAGRVCEHVYFLTDGLIRCFYEEESSAITSWFMKKGDIFVSIQSFYTQTVSNESIQAIEKSQVLTLHYKDLEYIYRNFPEFNVHGRVITEKYIVQLNMHYYLNKLKSASKRYEYFLENYGDLAHKISSKDIASFLNISEAHLSAVKSKR